MPREEFFMLQVGDGPARPAPLAPGLSLAQNLFLAGAFADLPLCSGLGGCGLCRVRYLDDPPPPLPKELAKLSPILLAQGYRLSCQRQPRPGQVIQLEAGKSRSVSQGDSAYDPGAVLGVDLGTTSLQWRLRRCRETLAEGGGPNPQMGGGAEVMSRLALARNPRGAARLREVVLARLREIISSLPVKPGLIGLAGNPAMICLALGKIAPVWPRPLPPGLPGPPDGPPGPRPSFGLCPPLVGPIRGRGLERRIRGPGLCLASAGLAVYAG